MTINKAVLVTFVLISLFFVLSDAQWAKYSGKPTVTYEDQTSITAKENNALEKFRKIIKAKLPTKSKYVNKYAQDDLYLVRWVRAKDLDVKEAEKFFMQNLEWRIREKMDTIDEEDWSDMKKEFSAYNDIYDKDKRPVAELSFGDWPVRDGVIAGKSRRISRWCNYIFEIQHRRLYDARANGTEVANAVLNNDLENFSVIQQACPACLPVYLTISTVYEEHYPGMYESMNYFNAPRSFDIIIRLVRPGLRESSRNCIKTYTRKEDVLQWFKLRMDKDQTNVRYGGTKLREAV